MNKLALLYPAILSLMLGGCAVPPIKPVSDSLNNSNSSIVSISRPKTYLNSAVKYRIFINDEYIGTLINGGRVKRRLPIGVTLINLKAFEFGGIPSFGGENLEVVIEPGQLYDVVMNTSTGSVIASGGIVSVQKSVAMSVSRQAIVE